MSGYLAARGAPPVLQNLAVSQLGVDGSYQRSIDKNGAALIQRIARAWDWSLCQPLVVARRGGGGLFVIDGQHRLEAAKARGDIPWLPCVVVDHDTPAGEAAAFVALNAQRRPLTPMALFRADLASGNPAATALDRLITGAGLRLTADADAGAWKPGWINNIVAIRQSYRKHGDRVTRLSLEALAKGFQGQVLRNCGTLWRGIVPTIAAAGPDYNEWLFAEVLRGADQAQWVQDIRRHTAETGLNITAAAGVVMGAAYREAAAE